MKFKQFLECNQFWNTCEKNIPERPKSKFKDAKVETHIYFFNVQEAIQGKQQQQMPAWLDSKKHEEIL